MSSHGLKGRRNPARGESPGIGRTARPLCTLKGCRSRFPRPFRPPEVWGAPRPPGFTRGWASATLQAARDRLSLVCATHPLSALDFARSP